MELQEKLRQVDKEKLTPQADKSKTHSLGKGHLVPPQVLTCDKANTAVLEEECKKQEQLAVQRAQAAIHLEQEAEHVKFLAKQAAEKQKARAKQDAKKAKLLEQLQAALQAQQSEEEGENLVCAEGEEGGLRILPVGVGDS